MAKFNLAAAMAAITVTSSDKRVVTSKDVKRPSRDIRSVMSESARNALTQGFLQSLPQVYKQQVDAKGAVWLPNHDDMARLIRVTFNNSLLAVGEKMDQESARNVWSVIHSEAFRDEPPVTFTDTDNAAAELEGEEPSH
jgi:hypothetical protein